MTDIYPLTIVKDRYGGTYSGGKWLAFNEDPYMIRQEPFSDDVTCAVFWDTERQIGVGQTKDEAIEDLKEKINSKQRTG